MQQSANEANWVIMEITRKTLTNLYSSGQITDGRGDETHIPGSFVLTETTIDARIYIGTPTVVNLTGKLNLAADGRLLSIRMEMLPEAVHTHIPFDLPPLVLYLRTRVLVSSEQITNRFLTTSTLDSSEMPAESTQDDCKG